MKNKNAGTDGEREAERPQPRVPALFCDDILEETGTEKRNNKMKKHVMFRGFPSLGKTKTMVVPTKNHKAYPGKMPLMICPREGFGRGAEK